MKLSEEIEGLFNAEVAKVRKEQADKIKELEKENEELFADAMMAREEQREACARAVIFGVGPCKKHREYCETDRTADAAVDAVRATPLDSTPLADRIRELEAEHLRDKDELGKLDAELFVLKSRCDYFEDRAIEREKQLTEHKAELDKARGLLKERNREGERRVAEAVLELCDRTLREDPDYSAMDPFPCLRTLNLDAILGGGE